MTRHYLIYGHGGAYNHGAEALVRTTIDILRQISPECKITLSTHFASQDREFGLAPDEFAERNARGGSYAEIYAPTIEKITAETVCLHSGGDNYCYKNWQRWAEIHYAAIECGAKSVLWSCSVDPDMMDSEMLGVLKTHHLITARESITYNALIERGLTNVIKVSDVAFSLAPEPVDFELENYVVLNVSPLVIKRNPLVHTAYQNLLDYLLEKTDMNVALVPHVLQPMDNDYEALTSLDAYGDARVKLAHYKLTAGQYKSIISKARFCVAARTHAIIAAYSTCVPALALGYSSKAQGIAHDLDMGEYVVETGGISDGMEVLTAFITMMAKESDIQAHLKKIMPSYIENVMNFHALETIKYG